MRTASAARGVTLFLGGLTLLNLYGAWRTPGFNPNVWWIDIGTLPDALSGLLLATAACLLLAWTARPTAGVWRRRATLAALAVLAIAALDNCVTFYRVWAAGEIAPRIPVPFSTIVLVVLVWLFVLVSRGDDPIRARATAPAPPPTATRPPAPRPPAPRPLAARARAFLVGVLAFCACGLLFPLAQFWFFGFTDYRRPADAAVVFGAQVHSGGRPSVSLNDRVLTAVNLYNEGLVDTLIMSGGVGESGHDESLVMRDVAIAEGVPPSAIVVDGHGMNTQATVDDTAAVFAARGFDRVIAVSHFYHLARIKLTYARAGYDVFTVPAKKTGDVPQTPAIVTREIAGFWVYYLRAVAE